MFSKKRPRSPSPSGAQTFRSAPINDRSSTFIAVYSPTISAKRLQADPSFEPASHRIAAWRKPSTQRTLGTQTRLYDSGHDDDGEQYAGKRLQNLMDNMNVEGSVVVARWYGGVMLGPVRFTHIENCAREAIGKAKGQVDAARKQVKLEENRKRKEEEELERETLLKVLPERDASIAVLRLLLVDKTMSASQGKASTTPVNGPNYTMNPLDSLRKLEKAKDATIAYLLKKIDEIEEHEKSGPPVAVSRTAPLSDNLQDGPSSNETQTTKILTSSAILLAPLEERIVTSIPSLKTIAPVEAGTMPADVDT